MQKISKPNYYLLFKNEKLETNKIKVKIKYLKCT